MDQGDRTPQQQDLDVILDHLLQFAQQTLRRYGEFYPFGASLTIGGEIVREAAKLLETDMPQSQPLIDLIVTGLRAEAASEEIRAAGLCYDVRVELPGRPKSDAIFVRLEHKDGLAVECFMPYSKRAIRGFKFDQLVAQPGQPAIFN